MNVTRTLAIVAGAVILTSAAQADVTGVSVELVAGGVEADGVTPFGPQAWLDNGYDALALNTYRIYLNFDDPSEQLNAVYGNSTSPLQMGTMDGSGFVNTVDFFGNPSNTAVFDQSPLHWENLWDTYVTIDVATSNAGDATQTSPGFAGLVGDLAGDFTLTNGSWFLTVADAPQGDADGGQVMVAQITTAYSPDTGGAGIQGVLNAQIAGGAQFAGLDYAMNVPPIPGPGALALIGLAGLAGTRRRRG